MGTIWHCDWQSASFSFFGHFWHFGHFLGALGIQLFQFPYFGHCDWRGWAGHPRFKGLLVQLGKPTTCESMYEELMAAKKSGAVRFASQTSAVTNADQIRKLLRHSSPPRSG